jgi:hypothetical protein
VRSLVAFLVLTVAALLVPVSTVGWWAHDALIPADGFVGTVRPLATNPAVVAEVEDRLVTETLHRIEASTGVPAGQVEPLVRPAVRRAVSDPAFARAWEIATRTLHAQLVGILSGRTRTTRSGTMTALQLAPLSDTVRKQLSAAGVPFADRLPTVRAALPLLPSDDLARARGAYRLLDTWGRVLPFVVLVLAALGALLARRGARALARAAFGSLVALGLLAVVVLAGRVAAPSVLPSSVPSPVAAALYDTVTAGLWHDVLVAAAMALAVFLGATLTARLTRP